MVEDLDTFIKENRRFIRLKAGDSFEGTYRGYIVAPDPFNKDLENPKKIVVYRLQEDGDPKVLSWSCKQTRVAQEMNLIAIGKKVRIQRTGSGASDTRYTITVL